MDLFVKPLVHSELGLIQPQEFVNCVTITVKLVLDQVMKNVLVVTKDNSYISTNVSIPVQMDSIQIIKIIIVKLVMVIA